MVRLLLPAALLLFSGLQDEKACDVSKTGIREYCPGCKAWPATEHLDKGFCGRCKAKLEKLETCIKYYWDCPKAHDKPRRHAQACNAAPGCCTERPSLAIVAYTCPICHARAPKEIDFKHTNEKCEGTVGKTCSLSTKFPHGGSE